MKKLLASLLLGAGLMFGGFSAMAQDAAKPAEAPAAAAAPAADAAAAPAAAPAADAAAAPAAAAAAAPAEAAPAAAAEAAPAPTPNKGDTAWMMVSTLLVILMTVPGLALFYGVLVRIKHMLSLLMQVRLPQAPVCEGVRAWPDEIARRRSPPCTCTVDPHPL